MKKNAIENGFVDADLPYGTEWLEGERRPQSRGRNGSFATTALTLRGALPRGSTRGVLTLAPANSHGQVTGSCLIEIPADPEWLRGFAEALLRISEGGRMHRQGLARLLHRRVEGLRRQDGGLVKERL